MNNIFKKLIVIIVIIIILILIAIFGFGSNKNPPKPINDTPNEAVNKTKSVYDGTYKGTFNYEYRDDNNMSGKIGPWIAGSFTLTVTFKTIGMSSRTDLPDSVVYLDATNAVASDPNFGTGTNGTNPTTSFDGEQSAWLPIDPAKQDFSGITDMQLYFNSAHNSWITIKKDDIKISPDGKTLSSNPNFKSTCTGNPCYGWEASTPDGTFSLRALHKQEMDRGFRFDSWILTKVSPTS